MLAWHARALGLFLASTKSAMVVYASYLSTQEAEAGKSGGNDQLWLHQKFGAKQIYIKPCLNNKKEKLEKKE